MAEKGDGKGCADSPVIVAALFDWIVKTFKRSYSMSLLWCFMCVFFVLFLMFDLAALN